MQDTKTDSKTLLNKLLIFSLDRHLLWPFMSNFCANCCKIITRLLLLLNCNMQTYFTTWGMEGVLKRFGLMHQVVAPIGINQNRCTIIKWNIHHHTVDSFNATSLTPAFCTLCLLNYPKWIVLVALQLRKSSFVRLNHLCFPMSHKQQSNVPL